jgi:LmbE family N-acetylglucosaminyl deacetylase
MSILVLSPHTDDAELGCGATISRLVREGNKVRVAVFSMCKESLPKGLAPDTLKTECVESLTSLGVLEEDILFYDYQVRVFNYARQSILDDMIVLKKKLEPKLVFIPSVDDYHQDHKTIADEAVRCFKNNCSVLSYELIWNNTSFKNQIYYDLLEQDVKNKITALSKYETQKNRIYFQNNFIQSLATVRGAQNGIRYAEVFEVIRYKI